MEPPPVLCIKHKTILDRIEGGAPKEIVPQKKLFVNTTGKTVEIHLNVCM